MLNEKVRINLLMPIPRGKCRKIFKILFHFWSVLDGPDFPVYNHGDEDSINGVPILRY